MNVTVYDLVIQGARALYLLITPFVIALTVAGILTSVLQAALTIQEGSLNYAVRLITLVVLLYVFLPTASQTLIGLAELAFR